MAHDRRSGLVTYPGGDTIIPSYEDAQQWTLAAAADRRLMLRLSGGAGVYKGGAQVLADLTDGKHYPACSAWVSDGVEAWPCDGAAQAITFNVSSSASAKLYLVVSLVAGVTPRDRQSGV